MFGRAVAPSGEKGSYSGGVIKHPFHYDLQVVTGNFFLIEFIDKEIRKARRKLEITNN